MAADLEHSTMIDSALSYLAAHNLAFDSLAKLLGVSGAAWGLFLFLASRRSEKNQREHELRRDVVLEIYGAFAFKSLQLAKYLSPENPTFETEPGAAILKIQAFGSEQLVTAILNLNTAYVRGVVRLAPLKKLFIQKINLERNGAHSPAHAKLSFERIEVAKRFLEVFAEVLDDVATHYPPLLKATRLELLAERMSPSLEAAIKEAADAAREQAMIALKALRGQSETDTSVTAA